jgi:deferrochelatase/peroxidase EfeB
VATPDAATPVPKTATPVPKTPEPAASTTPEPKNADELMKDAQAAYVRGERGRAMELALQVAEGGGADAERAWRFIGSAACSVRNALMANKAYTQLASGEHKQMLLELCQRNGLSFQNGQFGPPTAE